MGCRFPLRTDVQRGKFITFAPKFTTRCWKESFSIWTGVLVNNTQAHVRAFAIFCERHGVTGWRDKLATAYGMGNDDIMRRILPPELIREQGMQQLGEEKEAIYRAIYAPETAPWQGSRSCCTPCVPAACAAPVGSSGPKANVDFVLEACGIADCFDACICGDRVSRCKPDPEIYLKAAAALGLPPSRCLVFEDAPAGIESARRARSRMRRRAGDLARPRSARTVRPRPDHKGLHGTHRPRNVVVMLRGIATVVLLVCSNAFMTLAWYGHIAFRSKLERFGLRPSCS